jgi:hypothetical protein
MYRIYIDISLFGVYCETGLQACIKSIHREVYY